LIEIKTIHFSYRFPVLDFVAGLGHIANFTLPAPILHPTMNAISLYPLAATAAPSVVVRVVVVGVVTHAPSRIG